MMLPTLERIEGASLPDTELWWYQDDTLVDFSVAHTYTCEVEPFTGGALAFAAKTSGFTGAATGPNLVIAWAAGELAALEPNTYRVEVTATRTSDGKPRKRQWKLVIVPTVS